MLVVVEPTARSLATAAQIKSLADDLKLGQIYIVGSKVHDAQDRAYIEENTPALPVLGHLPEDPGVREADRIGAAVSDTSPALVTAANTIMDKLKQSLA
jgi:CO dehydrogenase nickel-insertion accessory protein CooC1